MEMPAEPAERGTVLVTGAGRGIGRATALVLAEAGYPLALLSRSADALEETHGLCERHAPTVSGRIDVRDERQVRTVHDLLRDAPPLHAVVNNAGVGDWAGIEDTTLEQWDDQLATNLRGAFLV